MKFKAGSYPGVDRDISDTTHFNNYGAYELAPATGEATVSSKAIPGFGLTTAKNWPTSFPALIGQVRPQIIIASWSWDQDGPTPPNAVHQPVAYTALLRRAVTVMLTRGNGVDGVVFTQFPISGNIPAANPGNQGLYNRERADGVIAWNDIAATMTSFFRGRVMYLPVASSLLLNGHFSAWLPPVGHPHEPASRWTRIRKVDNVHLCPEGSVRYAAAILSDLTALFKLAPASPTWTQGAWTRDPNFNDPPGACPDDHPPT